MSIVNNETAVTHPKGKILLMNGNILECYPKTEAPDDIKPEAGLGCERSVIKKDGEIHALTYYLAGSPLSGINRCNAVTCNGETENVSFSGSFAELWRPFMAINKRYTEAQGIYQAYSLEETIARLR